jgi:hypothetical protein
VDSDDDRGMSTRLGAEDWRWSSTSRVLDGQTIGRSGNVVYDLHRAQEDNECIFLGLALKPRLMVSPGLTSKPVDMVLVI